MSRAGSPGLMATGCWPNRPTYWGATYKVSTLRTGSGPRTFDDVGPAGILYATDEFEFPHIAACSGYPECGGATGAAACGRPARQPGKFQAPGLCGAEERHRLDGRLHKPRRDQARRAPPGAPIRHQPHAGARGHGAARARGFRSFGAAARRLCGAQDQARGDRADHRLGGAGKHGGAVDHRERERRRHRVAAAHVRHLRERRGARPSRRIFRNQYRLPPDHHPHERQRHADQSGGKPVHPYAHDPAQDHRDHALGLAEHVAKYADYLD